MSNDKNVLFKRIFLVSVLGHFIENTFLKNFKSEILYGYCTPIYIMGCIFY